MLNLLVVLGITFLVALVLVYFISAHDRRYLHNKHSPPTSENSLQTMRQFAQSCTNLLETLKLDILQTEHMTDAEFVLRARSRGPAVTQVDYLIAGYLLSPHEALRHEHISTISDQVVSERLSKAIIFTTGIYDAQSIHMAEQAPIEIVDGQKLATLLKTHTLAM